jgi:hypothetical protein
MYTYVMLKFHHLDFDCFDEIEKEFEKYNNLGKTFDPLM